MSSQPLILSPDHPRCGQYFLWLGKFHFPLTVLWPPFREILHFQVRNLQYIALSLHPLVHTLSTNDSNFTPNSSANPINPCPHTSPTSTSCIYTRYLTIRSDQYVNRSHNACCHAILIIWHLIAPCYWFLEIALSSPPPAVGYILMVIEVIRVGGREKILLKVGLIDPISCLWFLGELLV